MFKKIINEQKELNKEIENIRTKLIEINKQIDKTEGSDVLEYLNTSIEKLNTNITELIKKSEELEKLSEVNAEYEKKEFKSIKLELSQIKASIETYDSSCVKRLNANIYRLLDMKKILFVLIPILGMLFIFIIMGFVYFCPFSPVYQSTRRQMLFNNALENNLTENSAGSDAIKIFEHFEEELQQYYENHPEAKKDGNR